MTHNSFDFDSPIPENSHMYGYVIRIHQNDLAANSIVISNESQLIYNKRLISARYDYYVIKLAGGAAKVSRPSSKSLRCRHLSTCSSSARAVRRSVKSSLYDEQLLAPRSRRPGLCPRGKFTRHDASHASNRVPDEQQRDKKRRVA